VTGLLRRAGAGVDAAGSRVVWTVAEGRKGRRWREVRMSAEGGIVSSLLLETDPDGRFLHTELSTAAGLLTLHPELDGTLHGNVVTTDGVRHVVGLPWSADGAFVLEGSPIAVAAAAHLRTAVGEGTPGAIPAVLVGLDLEVAVAVIEMGRPRPRAWQIGTADLVELDAGGLPALADGASWPLETG
jgi:hypothetical protein